MSSFVRGTSGGDEYGYESGGAAMTISDASSVQMVSEAQERKKRMAQAFPKALAQAKNAAAARSSQQRAGHRDGVAQQPLVAERPGVAYPPQSSMPGGGFPVMMPPQPPTGARLVVLGTLHLCRGSIEAARSLVRSEKPDCLVLERRMGDDGLQALAIPEDLFQELSMPSAPSVLKSSDSSAERVAKFWKDWEWLNSCPGWNVGTKAALSQEFGAAFEEFVQLRQRLASEMKSNSDLPLRGGTVVFGDSDLRALRPRTADEELLPMTEADMGEKPFWPIRDLQLAQVMQAALRTHSTVFAVVGRDHLDGICKLLLQDPDISLVAEKGYELKTPVWVDQLRSGGEDWTKAAVVPNSPFPRLIEEADKSPIGTFLSMAAASELLAMRDAARKQLEVKGLGEAVLPAPRSSVLAADFAKRGELITPRDQAELEAWLSGERVGSSDPGSFPCESSAR